MLNFALVVQILTLILMAKLTSDVAKLTSDVAGIMIYLKEGFRAHHYFGRARAIATGSISEVWTQDG